ncbi:hypothetical protein [Brevundimonas albigilva]|uniref:Uncharacterized protein n=1 Tax=Brevundimonas albigilva TaxID=1312364 RepID=A0ABY4SM82_9CAUL|nr:hypothetical protein [Brevundimonas albigilva]URI15827.1 hypothetical protein M8231_02195 [Brevundimonas albigilva]
MLDAAHFMQRVKDAAVGKIRPLTEDQIDLVSGGHDPGSPPYSDLTSPDPGWPYLDSGPFIDHNPYYDSAPYFDSGPPTGPIQI